jgi:hypothetical protein
MIGLVLMIELGGFVGLHVFNDDNELGVRDSERAQPAETGPAFGIRMAFDLLPCGCWAAEAELALAPTQAEDTDVDVLAIGWRAHTMWRAPAIGRVRPMLLAGGGAFTASSADRRVLHVDTDLLFHAGAGVTIRLGERWGLRVDARVLFPPSTAGDTLTVDGELFVGLTSTIPPAPAR